MNGIIKLQRMLSYLVRPHDVFAILSATIILQHYPISINCGWL